MKPVITLCMALLTMLGAASAAAVVPSVQHNIISFNQAQGQDQDLLQLAADTEIDPRTIQTEPGTLIVPTVTEQENEKEKKCMTVCGRWGEECMFINRGAGGMTKKCRRACKKFVEECF